MFGQLCGPIVTESYTSFVTQILNFGIHGTLMDPELWLRDPGLSVIEHYVVAIIIIHYRRH